MAAITDLPPEIFDLILDHLSDRDLLHLRRTGKQICAQTSPLSNKIHFSRYTVMLEKRSLEILAGISDHPAISQSVECLDICNNYLLPGDESFRLDPTDLLKPFNAPANGLNNPNTVDARRRVYTEGFRQALASQEDLVQAGYGVDCLTNALKKLVNCREIWLGDQTENWSSGSIHRESGIRVPSLGQFGSRERIDFVRNFMHAVLTAIVASNMQIKGLRIMPGRQTIHVDDINPHMLTGPSSPLLDQASVLSVESLELWLNPDCRGPEAHSTTGTWATNLVQFTQRFPHLSELKIKFSLFDDYDDSDEMTWKTPDHPRRSRFAELSSILRIPNLQTVCLENLDCTAQEMLTFLTRHSQTLRKVRFQNANLVRQGMDWPWLIQHMRNDLDLSYFSMRKCLRNYDQLPPKARGPLEAMDKQGLDGIISRFLD